MALELGDRLVEVGLVTRAQLGAHGTQPHGAALARRLVSDGLLADALAGFFVAEGFGPLQGPGALAEADQALLDQLPAQMAVDFLVLPLRRTPSGVLVAMAVPSDRHLVREVSRALGTGALPTVARVSDLLDVLAQRLPGVGAPPEEREPEPIVLDLVRRRAPAATPRSERVTTNIRPPLAPAAVPAEDDEPIALVRHKPIASRPRIDPAAIRAEAGPVPQVTPEPPRVMPEPPREPGPDTKVSGALLSKRFAPPGDRSRNKSTTSEYERASKPAPAPEAKPETKAEPSKAEPAAPAPEGTDKPADRWDLPPPAEPAERPSGKLASGKASLPSHKGSVPDVGPTLAAMKQARDRDALVRLACEGAISVGRSAVFLALRKGVLKGWDGAGQGVSRDSVRNLWIPASSESMFKRALDSGAPFVGAYGNGIADGLFRAAVGSRGGDVAVWPVLIEGKVVGLLCVDDLRPGSVSRHRIETLTVAIAEGFRRLIHSGKIE